MNLGVASRFAVLKVEGDEDIKKTGYTKPPEIKSKVEKNKSKTAQNNSAKKPASSGASRKKKKKNLTTPENQWDEWKNVDRKQVSEFYEDDLQQALLLSKLDFEQTEKDDATNSANSSSRKKKKDTKQTVSLDKFNEMSAEQIEHLSSNDNSKPAENEHLPVAPDTQFFENIEKDAEDILSRELQKDVLKDRKTFLVDSAMSLQVQKELDEKDARIIELENQMIELKEKVKSLKARNKSLICLLAQAETKEKAQILAQNQQLQQIKDELVEQVSTLHAALEQEKSKVHKLRDH